MLVVDANVLVVALTDDADDGDRARARLHGEVLAAPDLIDLEVTSVVRGRRAGGHLNVRRAEFAVTDLVSSEVAPATWGPRSRSLRYGHLHSHLRRR